MTRRRRPLQLRGRCARGIGVGLKHLRASPLDILKHRELELLRMRQTLQARELRGRVQRLRDEALIFAIEEETDLAKRFKVLFLGQLHHSQGI
jgi:hypothetical protein